MDDVASLVESSRTGATVLFDRRGGAIYNATTASTSATVTLDFTGAVAGGCVQWWFDGSQIITISSSKTVYSSGIQKSGEKGCLFLYYDGVQVTANFVPTAATAATILLRDAFADSSISSSLWDSTSTASGVITETSVLTVDVAPISGATNDWKDLTNALVSATAFDTDLFVLKVDCQAFSKTGNWAFGFGLLRDTETVLDSNAIALWQNVNVSSDVQKAYWVSTTLTTATTAVAATADSSFKIVFNRSTGVSSFTLGTVAHGRKTDRTSPDSPHGARTVSAHT